MKERNPANPAKTWNVLVPVVDLVAAGTREEAISILESKLRAAGFDPYEGAASDAFESEESEQGEQPEELSLSQLSMLKTYESGPRIWDAASLIGTVHSLANQGLIELGCNGTYRLTRKGRRRLEETA